MSNWKDAVRKGSAAMAIFGMLAGGVSIASILIFSDHGKPQPTPSAAPRTSLAPPPPRIPTAREFTVTVIVTAVQCDPASECNYTYSIEPKYTGLHPFPPTEFTVEYDVVGGHQPQPGNFTVKGEQAQIMKDVTLAGPPNATLVANVTKVVDGVVSPVPPPGAPPPPPAP